MRVMRWHPGISHVAEHSGMVAKLELLGETSQPELSRLFANPDVPINEFLKFVVSHYSVGLSRGLSGALIQEGSRRSFGALFGQESFEGRPDVFLALDQHSLEIRCLEPAENVEHRRFVIARAKRLDLAITEQVANIGQFLGGSQRGRIIGIEIVAVG